MWKARCRSATIAGHQGWVSHQEIMMIAMVADAICCLDLDMFKVHCIVFGHLWTLTPLHTLWSPVLSLPKCIYCSRTISNLLDFQGPLTKDTFVTDKVACFKEVLRCWWNMFAHNIKVAGVNISSKSLWISTNFVYINP